jgi:heme/copper-type cytochrome/quinol oxidase subunit 3
MAIRADAHPFPAISPGKMGMWWFLASEMMLFGGLIATYVVFRVGAGGWVEERAHTSLLLGALNTLLLLTSSMTMVMAWGRGEEGERAGVRRYLGWTILLGLGFLGVKGVEYASKVAAGLTPVTAPFWSFYFTMTGLHALHVLAGIVILALLWREAGRGLGRHHRVELGGLYWHFVDIVWIFLFPLLYMS